MTLGVTLRQTDHAGGRETHKHTSVDGTRSIVHNHHLGNVNHFHGEQEPGTLVSVFSAGDPSDKWELLT